MLRHRQSDFDRHPAAYSHPDEPVPKNKGSADCFHTHVRTKCIHMCLPADVYGIHELIGGQHGAFSVGKYRGRREDLELVRFK